MKTLVIQIIIRQWDKSELTERHQHARQTLPDRYPISHSAMELADNRVLLDQQGDDYSGNRIRYQLTDNHLLIDRFRFDLETRTIEYKATLQTDAPAIVLATRKDGWIQCQYQWRYRVDEGGFIYWRYENVTLNAGFTANNDENIFMSSHPEKIFRIDLNPVSEAEKKAANRYSPHTG